MDEDAAAVEAPGVRQHKRARTTVVARRKGADMCRQ
jgi:hypothetical protein